MVFDMCACGLPSIVYIIIFKSSIIQYHLVCVAGDDNLVSKVTLKVPIVVPLSVLLRRCLIVEMTKDRALL